MHQPLCGYQAIASGHHKGAVSCKRNDDHYLWNDKDRNKSISGEKSTDIDDSNEGAGFFIPRSDEKIECHDCDDE